MQVNPQNQPDPRQAAIQQIKAVTSDNIVTPQELSDLQTAIQNTALSASDKQILNQVVNKIAEHTATEGDQYLSNPQMREITSMLSKMESPAAAGFSNYIQGQNHTQSTEGKSFFQSLWEGIKNFFGAIGNAISSLFGGGDSQDVTGRAQAGFNPTTGQTEFPSADQEQVERYQNYEHPQLSREDSGYDTYLNQQVQAGNPADMYQRSPHHDDTKFVPRFPMTAFHESGVHRTANDPYGVGGVSRPRQASEDLGGVTYGIYQFESGVQSNGSGKPAGHTLERFINDPANPFGAQLKAAADQHGVGSSGFDAVWKQLAAENNTAFGTAQEDFMLRDKQKTVENFVEHAGLSDEVRNDPRVIDLIVGTTNQVGGLALQVADHLATLATQRGRPLTVSEVGVAAADFKLSRVAQWFKSSPGAQDGVVARVKAEKEEFKDQVASDPQTT